MNLSTGKIACRLCKEEFGTVSRTISQTNAAPSTVTYILTLSLTNGATLDRECSLRDVGDPFETITNTITSINDARTKITIKKVGKFKSTWKTIYSGYATVFLMIGGVSCSADTTRDNMYPDKIAPTISQIKQEPEETDDWATIKKITVSGTENYCNNVTVTMLDDENNKVYEGTTTVSNNQYSISFTPEIEADENGKKFTVMVTDNCANSKTQSVTIKKWMLKPQC